MIAAPSWQLSEFVFCRHYLWSSVVLIASFDDFFVVIADLVFELVGIFLVLVDGVFELVLHRPSHAFSLSSSAWAFLGFSDVVFAHIAGVLMVIDCFLPVPLCLAVTFKIPLASRLNVTSICGTPRGAGAIPSRMNLPERFAVVGNTPHPVVHVSQLRLVVSGSRKCLTLCSSGWSDRFDQLGRHAAHGLDTVAEWRHVEQQHVFDITCQHATP